MCLHTYFEPDQVQSLFDSLSRMWADYKRPIWLNEFACPPYKQCSADDQLTFMQKVLPRLEALPYLFRYAWFEARAQGNESLLVPSVNASSAELTALGRYYNDFVPNTSASQLP